MKFYSELTKKLYDSKKDCEQAEYEHQIAEAKKFKAEEEKHLAEKKKQEERAMDAKKVETAREAMVKAQHAYRETLDAFVKKHGSYHFTTDSVEKIPYLFESFFDFLK